MKERKLGRTNLNVSALCLDGAKLGLVGDEASAQGLLDAYLTCGGSFIQTVGLCPTAACPAAPSPEAEGTVGRWLRSRGVPRDRIVIATRLLLQRPDVGGSIALDNLIRTAVEGSLRRLGTTHLDLLICEWDESLVPVEDVTEAVDRLIQAGLVRYLVGGGFPAWRLVDSLHRSSVRRHARFEATQMEYSLMARAAFEEDVIAVCREYRLGFVARSPLAGGFLARHGGAGSHGGQPAWLDERFGTTYADTVLDAVTSVANRRLATPAQIAVAWVLRVPEVSSALISAPTASDLRSLMRAADLVLSESDLDALERPTTVPDFRLQLRHA